MHGYSSHGRTKSGGSGGFGVGGGGGGGGGALAQPPGSVYRSPELFENLWPFMEDDSNRSYNAAVELTKFDYRLSNKLDVDLQKLRCRVNYHALKFTDPILEMGKKLVERMRMKSKHFIALHLRFESDMLAFSGCYYGGGDKERTELGALRKRWKTLHIRNPDKERRQGKCPLTPEEVGLMLRA